MLKTLTILSAAATLAGCATAQPPAGFLSSYEGLAPASGNLRAVVTRHRDPTAIAQVRRIALSPSVFAPGAQISWMTDAERQMLLRQMDAQLCFRFSRRFEIASDQPDARVRAAITMVAPNGRVSSLASAAANAAIPGPIGVRPLGGWGALAGEVEMIDAQNRQIAAMTWSRKAMAIGADKPSMSRIGDALQFAKPFAGKAAATFAQKGAPQLRIDAKADPCAAYGPRFRPGGMMAGMVTGLYVPSLSTATPERATKAADH